MSTAPSPREIFRECLIGLLYPVIRFAVRHALKFQDVVECLRIVFLKIAKEELHSLDEKLTVSKLSVMTGIQRREIKSLIEIDAPIRRDADVVTRIIGLWQSSARYKDKAGRPRILDFTGRKGEFASLVAEISTDLNPYTIAFELERAEIAQQTERGLKLLKPGYQPRENFNEAIGLLSEDASDLQSAVIENLIDAKDPPNLHVKTQYDNIPCSKEREIRDWFLKKGAELHDEARRYLAALDRDITPCRSASSKLEDPIRAVIGSFSYTARTTKRG